MNAAEHIIQSFFWQAESSKKPEGKHYLTISNVIGGNGSEIDILAMSPNGKDCLHVESHVDVNWPLTPEYIHYLTEGCIPKKFINNPHATKLISESFFADKDYRKILVVWKNPYENGASIPENLIEQRIEVWSITDLLQDLLKTVGTHNFQDDILRLMSMLSSMLSMNGALKNCGCKRVSAPNVNQISASDCIDAVAHLAKKCAEDSRRVTVTKAHVDRALELIDEMSKSNRIE